MPQAHAKFEYALWKSHSDQLHMCISQICRKPMNLSAVVLLYYPETCDGEDLVQTTWTVPVCDGDSGVLKIRVFFGNPQKNLCFSPTLLNRFRCKQLCTYLKVHSSSRFAYLTTWKSTRVCDSGHNLTFRKNVAKTLGVVQSSSQI